MESVKKFFKHPTFPITKFRMTWINFFLCSLFVQLFFFIPFSRTWWCMKLYLMCTNDFVDSKTAYNQRTLTSQVYALGAVNFMFIWSTLECVSSHQRARQSKIQNQRQQQYNFVLSYQVNMSWTTTTRQVLQSNANGLESEHITCFSGGWRVFSDFYKLLCSLFLFAVAHQSKLFNFINDF